ncbi:MAG: hypothetical protein QG660_669, partial [Pseudomonadota bacterium]|nr:hypothetical protein [Pseudomonadota bacterium]
MHIVNRRNVAAYFVETREIADAYFIDDHLNTWLQGGRSQFYG